MPKILLLLLIKLTVDTINWSSILKHVNQVLCLLLCRKTLKFMPYLQPILHNLHGQLIVPLKILSKVSTLVHVWEIFSVLTFWKILKQLIFSVLLWMNNLILSSKKQPKVTFYNGVI